MSARKTKAPKAKSRKPAAKKSAPKPKTRKASAKPSRPAKRAKSGGADELTYSDPRRQLATSLWKQLL